VGEQGSKATPSMGVETPTVSVIDWASLLLFFSFHFFLVLSFFILNTAKEVGGAVLNSWQRRVLVSGLGGAGLNGVGSARCFGLFLL
jgi:hypothetical protein